METIQTSGGLFREDGACRIPGVEGTSSPIKVAFLNPGGSMTGKMFPSGAKQETLTVQSRTVGVFQVRVSLVDAANPFVLVDSRSQGHPQGPDATDAEFISVVEDIRREGAVRFGLAADVEKASAVRGTPKIAFLSSPADQSSDLDVLSFTMGKPHASLQLTGAVCIGAAMAIHGTVAWHLANEALMDKVPKHGMEIEGTRIANAVPVGIRHPAGVIQAETVLGLDGNGDIDVKHVAVVRTARRLFEGNVFYRA